MADHMNERINDLQEQITELSVKNNAYNAVLIAFYTRLRINDLVGEDLNIELREMAAVQRDEASKHEPPTADLLLRIADQIENFRAGCFPEPKDTFTVIPGGADT